MANHLMEEDGQQVLMPPKGAHAQAEKAVDVFFASIKSTLQRSMYPSMHRGP